MPSSSDEAPLAPPDAFDAAAVPPNFARVAAAVAAAGARAGAAAPPRLVAVSKTKPAAAVAAAHAAGARHFGENYVQELLAKAPACAPDVAWHFIGRLQSNKAAALVAGVPNLWAVESVDSRKLAALLDRAAAAAAPARGGAPLRVFLQVNTSGEAQKGGVEPGAAAALAAFVARECPALRLQGLMTVGRVGEVDGACFARLRAEREAVAAALGAPWDAPGALELSMGMSADYEEALAAGSTSVRVGSAIFGARDYGAAAPPSAAGGGGGGGT